MCFPSKPIYGLFFVGMFVCVLARAALLVYLPAQNIYTKRAIIVKYEKPFRSVLACFSKSRTTEP